MTKPMQDPFLAWNELAQKTQEMWLDSAFVFSQRTQRMAEAGINPTEADQAEMSQMQMQSQEQQMQAQGQQMEMQQQQAQQAAQQPQQAMPQQEGGAQQGADQPQGQQPSLKDIYQQSSMKKSISTYFKEWMDANE
jgi:predicted sulfurtransferase